MYKFLTEFNEVGKRKTENLEARRPTTDDDCSVELRSALNYAREPDF